MVVEIQPQAGPEGGRLDVPKTYKPDTLVQTPFGSWTWETPDGQQDFHLLQPEGVTQEERKAAVIRGYQQGIAKTELEIQEYSDWLRDNPGEDQKNGTTYLEGKKMMLQGMKDSFQALERMNEIHG